LFIEIIFYTLGVDVNLPNKIKEITMSATTLNNKNTFLQENKTGFVILFILFLLSSVGMFGQEVKSTVVLENDITTVVTSTEITIADSAADIEFMTWFMVLINQKTQWKLLE
jgi:hypothetical protein